MTPNVAGQTNSGQPGESGLVNTLMAANAYRQISQNSNGGCIIF